MPLTIPLQEPTTEDIFSFGFDKYLLRGATGDRNPTIYDSVQDLVNAGLISFGNLASGSLPARSIPSFLANPALQIISLPQTSDDNVNTLSGSGSINANSGLYVLTTGATGNSVAETKTGHDSGFAWGPMRFSRNSRLRFYARFASLRTGTSDLWEIGIGLGKDASTNAAARGIHIRVVGDGSNTDLRFVTHNGGSTETESGDISGVTLTDWNLYDIVYTSGVKAELSVNTTLLIAISTNLPTADNENPFFSMRGRNGTTAATMECDLTSLMFEQAI